MLLFVAHVGRAFSEEIMCVIDLDPCDVWRERVRRANKRHACDCCTFSISKGEHYLYNSYIFEGYPGSEKICFACWWVREKFAEAHRGIHPAPSDMIDELRQCIDGDGEDSEWRDDLASILRRARLASRERPG